MVCGLLPPCYSPALFLAPALLLPYFSPAPASALPLPYSCPAPFKLLSSTFLAPPQFLPSSPLSALFCPVLPSLLSSAPALFLPCSCPAHASALLLPFMVNLSHYAFKHLSPPLPNLSSILPSSPPTVARRSIVVSGRQNRWRTSSRIS